MGILVWSFRTQLSKESARQQIRGDNASLRFPSFAIKDGVWSYDIPAAARTRF